MAWLATLVALLLASSATSRSLRSNALQFHTLEARQQNKPIVKLPYGSYQATSYDSTNDMYIFKNIRFAQPPVGPLRWAKPEPPAPNNTVFTGEYGPGCVASVPGGLLGGGLLSEALDASGSIIDIGAIAGGVSEVSEDCLFLDVYVPAKALEGQVKLPIVNWIYGGAYLLGSKEGQYDGTPLVAQSQGNLVYIAGNYRLGSFGFLAGDTMEKEATPNAGLWDQRAVLEWIQKYASLFGGDPENVTVMGESAGAGSIMHHLTAFGGKQPTLFKRAILQSPAYDPQIDRKGMLEEQFKSLAELVGCSGQGLQCMRSKDFKTVKTAQESYIASLAGGKPGFGPAADGTFVRQLPELELVTGNSAKGIEAIINSHVLDEAQMFVPSSPTEKMFSDVVQHYWGSSPSAVKAISNRYAVSNFNGDQTERIKMLFQFTTFTCHNRWLTEGYQGKTYNLQYARSPYIHASDLTADFYAGGISGFVTSLAAGSDFGTWAQSFQSYLTSFIRSGDPNKFRNRGTVQWPIAKLGPAIEPMLNATDSGFELGSDRWTMAEDCDFWKDVLSGMTNELGYAAPGSVVQSTIAKSTNPSANFGTS